MSDLEGQLSTERTRRMSECEEWRQFQADLLMTVRVANDFQTEAQVKISIWQQIFNLDSLAVKLGADIRGDG